MHLKLVSLALAVLSLAACSGEEAPKSPASEVRAAGAVATTQLLEAGCAGCVFGMEGAKGCELAVKLDGKPYRVSGIEMPGHESGLCEHAVPADIAGKLEGDVFVATSFTLKP